MISGGLFLNPKKEITIKMLFTKYIKRFVIAFLFWSFIYQMYYYANAVFTGSDTLNWKGIIYEAILGPYHMWYLYMLAGLYLITPMLRKITESKSITEYFIIIFFIFSFLQNYGVSLPVIGNLISGVMDKTHLPIGLMFIGYFILGYYIKSFNIPRKIECALYILAVLLLIFNCLVFSVDFLKDINKIWSVKYLMPNIIIESAAIYTFFVKRVSKINFSERTVKFFSKLTEYGFGVYLVHALINNLIGLTGWSAVTISPFISVPLLTIVIYTLSLLVTVLIRRIPFIGKNIT
jgi:surface polysaccharide O-acyltransferase-like enzyme